MYSPQERAYSLICLVAILLLGFTELSSATEPLLVRVEGMQGAAKKNIEAALDLPNGLIKDGTVDKLWLERFGTQAEAKTIEALEPFGYYSPRVSSSLGGNDREGYILLVRVSPGEQVRVTEVDVKLEGPGAVDALLLKNVASFPLRTGEPLLH